MSGLIKPEQSGTVWSRNFVPRLSGIALTSRSITLLWQALSLVQENQSVEQLGLELQNEAFPSLSRDDFDRLLKGRFYSALLPRGRRNLALRSLLRSSETCMRGLEQQRGMRSNLKLRLRAGRKLVLQDHVTGLTLLRL